MQSGHLSKIKSFLLSVASVDEGDWEYFQSKLQYRGFKKSDIITRFGQVENHLYFMLEGVARFVIDNEKEISSDFAFPNQFFSSYSSFLTRQPSQFEILPVTKEVKCLSLSFQNIQDLYAHTECGEKIGRLAAEQLFIKKSAREASLLTFDPRQKYLQLLHEQPHYIHAIPLKYLASYLGITPETLSRVRSSIS